MTERTDEGETPAPDAAIEAPSQWREQAVARSLDNARTRAEQRVQRFLDAATSLIDEKGGLDFTVQDVVERSGQSLRSFYQSFDGKQHLLLAVYEEAMHASAARILRVVAGSDDPVERLRLFVVTLYELCEREPIEEPITPNRAVRAMIEFVFQQMSTDPTATASATFPLFEQLAELIEQAQLAGAVRVGSPRRFATLVLQTTMFCAFGTTTRDTPETHQARAAEMWDFCFRGIAI